MGLSKCMIVTYPKDNRLLCISTHFSTFQGGCWHLIEKELFVLEVTQLYQKCLTCDNRMCLDQMHEEKVNKLSVILPHTHLLKCLSACFIYSFVEQMKLQIAYNVSTMLYISSTMYISPHHSLSLMVSIILASDVNDVLKNETDFNESFCLDSSV